jgi:hypothetical protein
MLRQAFSWKGFLVILALTTALLLYLKTVPDPLYRDPAPVRALKRNRSRIDRYLESLQAGRVPKRSDGRGYYVLDVLLDHEASTVQVSEGCVIITFSAMPSDPVPELIFSPRGKNGLPLRYQLGDGGQVRFLEFRPIDELWYYCLWDI